MVFAIFLMSLPDAEVDIDVIMPSCYNMLREIFRKISVIISNIKYKIANSIETVIKHNSYKNLTK